MTRLLITLFLVVVSACATVAQTSELHQDYVSIVDAINEESFEFVEQRIAESKKALHSDIEISEFSQKYPFIYSLGTVIAEEVSNFSTKRSGHSCLTVNGFDSVGEPVTVSVEFSFEYGLNKISYVALNYLESESEFSNSAVCPSS